MSYNVHKTFLEKNMMQVQYFNNTLILILDLNT